MNKWHYVKYLFKLIFSKPKKWSLQTGHTVEVAFYSGGKPYYKLSDLFNTFTERGLDAYQVYEEISMRIGRDDLIKFIDGITKLLNSNPIQMTEISKLIGFMEERTKFVMPPKEMIWKMAAVAYFDETESPYTYDSIYANKKIKAWKENGDVDDFFLYQQLKNLIPLPELSKEIYQLLGETIQKIEDYQSRSTFGNHSESKGEGSLFSESKSGQSTESKQNI